MVIGQKVDIDCLDTGDVFSIPNRRGVDTFHLVIGNHVTSLDDGKSVLKACFTWQEMTYLGCIMHSSLNEILANKNDT